MQKLSFSWFDLADFAVKTVWNLFAALLLEVLALGSDAVIFFLETITGCHQFAAIDEKCTCE